MVALDRTRGPSENMRGVFDKNERTGPGVGDVDVEDIKFGTTTFRARLAEFATPSFSREQGWNGSVSTD